MSTVTGSRYEGNHKVEGQLQGHQNEVHQRGKDDMEVDSWDVTYFFSPGSVWVGAAWSRHSDSGSLVTLY